MPYYSDQKLLLTRLARSAIIIGIFIYLMVDNGFQFDRGGLGIAISSFALLCFAFVAFGFLIGVKAYFYNSPRIDVNNGMFQIRQANSGKQISIPFDELRKIELHSGTRKYINLFFNDVAKSLEKFGPLRADPETLNTGPIAKNGLRISLAFMSVDLEALQTSLAAALPCEVVIANPQK